MSPEFPIRILFDDGTCEILESAEDVTRIDSIDSDDPHVWIRDAIDRTIHLRVRSGVVERFDVGAGG